MVNLLESEVIRLWRDQLMTRTELITESGESLKIIYTGRVNDGQGADFRDAVISIDNRVIRGDIEIHVKASDWWAHNHHRNPAYNRVVLHVVMWDDDKQATTLQNGRNIPILALYRYQHLSDEPRYSSRVVSTTLCPASTKHRMVGRQLAELDKAGERRFFTRVAAFRAEFGEKEPAQSLYRGIMGALGYLKNKKPFTELADLLPYRILKSEVNRSVSDEECLARQQALLLGTAGLLPSQESSQHLSWLSNSWLEKVEISWLSCSDNATMPPGYWHFFKVRPNNSPVHRLLAMSYLVMRFRKQGLLNELVGMIKKVRFNSFCGNLERELKVVCDDYTAGTTGDTAPYRKGSVTLLGSHRAADIIINVILPFTCAWGQSILQPVLVEKALALYRAHSRMAVNSIEKHMKKQLGLSNKMVNSARRQQGLIHLYQTLCIKGRCNDCPLS